MSETATAQSKISQETVYGFSAKSIDGGDVSLKEYAGKVLLIVNVASKCGFTPQYAELEALWKKYKDQGLIVLGFPCNQFASQEPAPEADIKTFCETHYQISFPLFSKIEVNGSNAHPLYRYLVDRLPGILGTKNIKWNFTKFLIDRSGHPVKRFGPAKKPQFIEQDIKIYLASK